MNEERNIEELLGEDLIKRKKEEKSLDELYENAGLINKKNSKEEPKKEVNDLPKGNLKVTEKGKKILVTGALTIVITGFGIGSIMGLLQTANETPNFSQPTVDVVEQVKEQSQIDEVLGLVDTDIVTELDQLSETIELSEKLHALNLEKYVGGLAKYGAPDEYSVQVIDEMIGMFKDLELCEQVENGVLSQEDRNFTQLALILEAYERTINSNLSNNAYQTLIDYGVPLVKTKVLDACGFAAEEVECMQIGTGTSAYVITFNDPKTSKAYEVTAKDESKYNSKGYIHKVIDSINDWQVESKDATSTGDSYNSERNEKLRAGINELKTLTLMNSEINNKNEIVVTTSMGHVNNTIKEMKKKK